MKVRFYGRLGEKLGAQIDFDPPAGMCTVGELRRALAHMFPDAAEDLEQRTRACIADSFVGEEHPLAEAETIEFFPPLSGG